MTFCLAFEVTRGYKQKVPQITNKKLSKAPKI